MRMPGKSLLSAGLLTVLFLGGSCGDDGGASWELTGWWKVRVDQGAGYETMTIMQMVHSGSIILLPNGASATLTGSDVFLAMPSPIAPDREEVVATVVSNDLASGIYTIYSGGVVSSADPIQFVRTSEPTGALTATGSLSINSTTTYGIDYSGGSFTNLELSHDMVSRSFELNVFSLGGSLSTATYTVGTDVMLYFYDDDD